MSSNDYPDIANFETTFFQEGAIASWRLSDASRRLSVVPQASCPSANQRCQTRAIGGGDPQQWATWPEATNRWAMSGPERALTSGVPTQSDVPPHGRSRARGCRKSREMTGRRQTCACFGRLSSNCHWQPCSGWKTDASSLVLPRDPCLDASDRRSRALYRMIWVIEWGSPESAPAPRRASAPCARGRRATRG